MGLGPMEYEGRDPVPGTIDALVEAFRLRGLSAGEAVSVLLAGAGISVVALQDGSECGPRRA